MTPPTVHTTVQHFWAQILTQQPTSYDLVTMKYCIFHLMWHLTFETHYLCTRFRKLVQICSTSIMWDEVGCSSLRTEYETVISIFASVQWLLLWLWLSHFSFPYEGNVSLVIWFCIVSFAQSTQGFIVDPFTIIILGCWVPEPKK